MKEQTEAEYVPTSKQAPSIVNGQTAKPIGEVVDGTTPKPVVNLKPRELGYFVGSLASEANDLFQFLGHVRAFDDRAFTLEQMDCLVCGWMAKHREAMLSGTTTTNTGRSVFPKKDAAYNNLKETTKVKASYSPFLGLKHLQEATAKLASLGISYETTYVVTNGLFDELLTLVG